MRTTMAALGALVVAILPARYWQASAFYRLPVERLVTASAILTIFGGAAIGISGFFAYAARVAASPASSHFEIARRQIAGELPETPAISLAPQAVAMLTPFAFALFTPAGLVATYLVFSGATRAVSAAVQSPFGDPILTGLDEAGRRLWRSRVRARERRAREQAEGADVPDRLYPGAWAGLPDVDLIVVSARRKPGWDEGALVITSDRWFRLGRPFDRQTASGLRTLYPLTENTRDVLRRGVPYELPPLSTGRRVPNSGP